MRAILSIFSFYGRARRTSYGVFFLVTVGALFAVGIPFFVFSLQHDQSHVLDKMRDADPKTAQIFDPFLAIPHVLVQDALIASAAVVLVLYVAWLAICVRRLHDMNATGWIVLLFVVVALVPYLGYLLISLVLGLWPGTKGANRYGPDPRGMGDVTDVFGPGDRAPGALSR